MPSSPAAESSRSTDSRGVAGRASRPAPRARTSGIVAAALAALLTGACKSGPAPRLYVLEPAATQAAPVTDTFDAIGTAIVTLPGYARDARIASRDAGIGVSLDDEHRWAEEPEEAITRVLLDSLRRHGGGSVLLEPFPRDFEPDARVEIDFDRLLRTAAGGAQASGRILLLSGDGRRLVDVLPFELERSAGSRSPTAFFLTLSRMIDELAQSALERLREGAPA